MSFLLIHSFSTKIRFFVVVALIQLLFLFNFLYDDALIPPNCSLQILFSCNLERKMLEIIHFISYSGSSILFLFIKYYYLPKCYTQTFRMQQSTEETEEEEKYINDEHAF